MPECDKGDTASVHYPAFWKQNAAMREKFPFGYTVRKTQMIKRKEEKCGEDINRADKP